MAQCHLHRCRDQTVPTRRPGPGLDEPHTHLSVFRDLWIKYRDWVFEPLEYPSIDDLIPKLGSAVVKPALERRKALPACRAEKVGTRSLDDFNPDEP